jgi:hypothetical protein
MDPYEYQQRRRALEKQCQEDLELVHAAYQAKLRALEMLQESSTGEKADAIEPVPAPKPRTSGWSEVQRSEAAEVPKEQETAPRLLPGALREAVEAVLPQLPEVFDRQAVEAALGFAPKRTTLVRILKTMCKEGDLWLEYMSEGGERTKYRKLNVR